MSVPKQLRFFSRKSTHIFRQYGKYPRTYLVTKDEKYICRNFSLPKAAVIRLPSSFHLAQSVHLYSTHAPETEAVTAPASANRIPELKFENMSFDQPVPHEDLVKELKQCKTIGEQMETLASTLALSPEDLQRRMKFCKALESFLEPFFNNLKIQMFGSTVNGFGFKGCDIDMTFETSGTEKEQIYYLERPDVPLVNEVLSGKVSPQEISELPLREQLLFLHTVFLEFYKDSKDAPIFINAHVPLVRFHHDKFNLKCDLTLKNSIAYANTNLLYLFSKLDERLNPLMMTLRYWAKHVELIGKGLMFNTYTITLLVIHFLQTRDPPVLPSAEYIISLSNSLGIDMTDKSFLKIADKISPSKNTQTIEELLRAFFFYYSYFDFTHVICPLTASSISRDEFFSGGNNPKFRMNSICVQDPMCVPHNVAELVDYKHCKKLFHELMVACKIFQDDLTVPSSESWGLMAILDKPEKFYVPNMTFEKLVSFTIPVMHKTIEGNNIPSEKRPHVTAETVLNILKDGLLFKCNVLEQAHILQLLKQQDDLVAKQKKIMESLSTAELQTSQVMRNLKKSSKSNSSKHHELSYSMVDQFQKFGSEHQLILSSECKTLKNIWLGRDCVKLDTVENTSLDILGREHLISVATAKQNKQNINEKNIKPFVFLYECYISNNSENSVIINFRPLQRMSFNLVVGIFLQEYIPKIVKKINESS